MSGWQPISTAPKDGREFMVVHAPPGIPDRYKVMAIVYWDEAQSDSFPWVCTCGQEAWIDEENWTHWRPLPDPPDIHSTDDTKDG